MMSGMSKVKLHVNQNMDYGRNQDKNTTKGMNVKTSCTTTGDRRPHANVRYRDMHYNIGDYGNIKCLCSTTGDHVHH